MILSIKSLISLSTSSFRDGAKEMIKWYKENTLNEEVDKDINDFMDRIIADYAVESR
jgi:uncharacterized protein YggL (DUF469 family)